MGEKNEIYKVKYTYCGENYVDKIEGKRCKMRRIDIVGRAATRTHLEYYLS